jgi:hypothetical protein
MTAFMTEYAPWIAMGIIGGIVAFPVYIALSNLLF